MTAYPSMLQCARRFLIAALVLWGLMLTSHSKSAIAADDPIEIGGRRELFVDHHLIDKLDKVSLQLQRPQPAGVAFRFDKPWEGQVSGYVTVLRDEDRYRMYYRGRPLTGYGDNDPRAKDRKSTRLNSSHT